MAPQTVDVGGVDLALGEADGGEQVEASARRGLPASMPSLSRQKSSPSVHLLKANLMSKAVGSAFSTLAMASSVKPLALSVVWLIAGACASVPWPTA